MSAFFGPLRLVRKGAWGKWAAQLVRCVAWTALIGVTGVLVRAEATRPELPAGVEAYTDVIYKRVGHRRMRLDIYRPTSQAPAHGWPIIVAIHGGGWRGGSKTGYGREVARLAPRGYVVVAITYRLTKDGEPSWPANIEDVRSAVRWIRTHASDYHADPDRIVAMGASAGGHLAALLGTCPDDPTRAQAPVDSGRTEAATPAPEPSARVQAVVDFYGPVDLVAIARHSPRAAEPVVSLLGGPIEQMPARYEAASPAWHVSCDTPPMLLVHGQHDAQVPLAQSEALDRALARAGVRHRLVVVPGAVHGFGLQVAQRDLVPDILDFLDSVWNDKRKSP